MKLLPHLEEKNQVLSAILDKSSLVEDSKRSAMFDNYLYASQNRAESFYKPMQETVNDFRPVQEKVEYVRSQARDTANEIDEAARDVAVQAVEKQPQDMQVSREDWNELKEELKEYGIDEKDISDLEEKVMSKNGMTYGQLVSELSGMMKGLKGIKLSPVQEQELNSVFAKLGLTPDESKSMLAFIRQGKLGKVVDKIQAKLAAMPDAQKLQFSEDESKTLNSIFKLTGDAGKKIAQLFTSAGATAADVKKGFAVLKDALVQQQKDQNSKDVKLVKSIGKSLRSAMDKATDQAPSHFKIASAEVITDSMGAAKDVSESIKSNNSNQNSADNSRGQNQSGKNFENGNSSQNSGNQNNNHMAQNSSADGQKHWLDKILSDSKGSDSWSDFFSKISDESLVKGEGGLNGSVFGNGIGALQNAAKAAQAGKVDGMWEKTARSNVLDQVRDGAFKNLGQGRKQLTLKLNPHDLGTVNVVLQVKNKEVQAVIKADNPDTAKVIAERLEVVKHALEEQGLKVEKLEVQTGISDRDTQNSWQNADDHNSSQYQEMMSEMKRRWHVLRQEGSSLAQEMHSVEQKATISQSGLYVVA